MRLAKKTLSFGMTHIVVAIAVAYAITGNLAMAVGIGLIEPIVQTCVFAVHDYAWENSSPTTSASNQMQHAR